MEELKNCPFCGGPADIWRHGQLVYVKCDICGAESEAFYLKDAEKDDWGNSKTVLKAVRRWNARTEKKE